MNTTLKRILCVILALILVLVLFLCIKNSKPADTSEETEVTAEDSTAGQDNEISFYEESDSAEIVPKKKAVDEFIGSWKATSARASYLFGTVNINIEADGTWNGYIAAEDHEGTWTEIQDGIHLTSKLFNGDLKFTKDDVLVMLYSQNDDGNYLVTVLTAE